MKTPGGEKPELDMGLGRGRCEHGMLDWDPQMEKTRVINEIGWGMLCQKYVIDRKADHSLFLCFRQRKEKG